VELVLADNRRISGTNPCFRRWAWRLYGWCNDLGQLNHCICNFSDCQHCGLYQGSRAASSDWILLYGISRWPSTNMHLQLGEIMKKLIFLAVFTLCSLPVLAQPTIIGSPNGKGVRLGEGCHEMDYSTYSGTPDFNVVTTFRCMGHFTTTAQTQMIVYWDGNARVGDWNLYNPTTNTWSCMMNTNNQSGCTFSNTFGTLWNIPNGIFVWVAPNFYGNGYDSIMLKSQWGITTYIYTMTWNPATSAFVIRYIGQGF